MALEKLTFGKTWTNPSHFPTYQESEAQVRTDLQYHPDALKDYLNEKLIPALEDRGVEEITRTDGSTMKYIRRNSLGGLETSRDGKSWTPAAGDTIVNDLTTGGTKAALSAEMGKTLDAKKVSKAGDTMTGDLRINNTSRAENATVFNSADGAQHKVSGGHNSLSLMSFNISENYNNSRALRLCNSIAQPDFANALRVQDIVDGTATVHTVLHTGNKPSGFYFGNGFARTIDIGGIGSTLRLTGNRHMCIVTGGGAIYKDPSYTIKGLSSNQVSFSSGVLTIGTNDDLVNACVNATGDVQYYYEVL